MRHVVPEKGNYLVAGAGLAADLSLVDARHDRMLS
jgi:hypothetical protein